MHALPYHFGPYRLSKLSHEVHAPEVLGFVTGNASYLEWQDHTPVTAETVHDLFEGPLPPGWVNEQRHILGVYEGEMMICLFDVLEDFPVPGTWVIGLMLLAENRWGEGLGQQLLEGLEQVLQQNDVKTARLGVLDNNDRARTFWAKTGFVENGQSRLHEDGRTIFVMEKPL